MDNSGGFNPKEHLIKLKQSHKDANGKWVTTYADYLEVKYRLVWFREKFPHGSIYTEEKCVDVEVGYARFHASISDGQGGISTGTGTEWKKSFEDYVEKAETRAIGRALAGLGIGTQFSADDLSEGGHIVDAPVSTSNPGVSPAPANDPDFREQVQVCLRSPVKDPARSGQPKNLEEKSELLKKIQHELARIGVQPEDVHELCAKAFGLEANTFELVCGESLSVLRHGLAYLKTVMPATAPPAGDQTPTDGTFPPHMLTVEGARAYTDGSRTDQSYLEWLASYLDEPAQRDVNLATTRLVHRSMPEKQYTAMRDHLLRRLRERLHHANEIGALS